ncbi:MAG TPA: AMP-binding protein [Vicinamibacterales bacterium]|jgi:fatty-acyl-CoA synthase
MLHADLVGERARLTPDKLALVDLRTGGRWSYEALNQRAARCAEVLRHVLGLRRGDRVALLSGNRLEFLDLFFGAVKSGIVIVPLGTRLTARELAFILRDCQPRAVFYDMPHAPVVTELAALVQTELWIALDPGTGSGSAQYADLADGVREPAAGLPPCRPEDTCCLLYTSGTTGYPKGVIIPHRMVAWNGYNTAVSWQLRDDDVTPVFTPLYHAGGLGAFLLPVLAIGGTVVLHEGFDPAEVWDTIEREGCTVVLGVPTIFRILMEAPQFRTVNLERVRYLISGGAPLPLHIIEAYQARGVVFKQGYGLTEVGVNCFAMTVADSVRKAGSVGKPMMFTEARLVDGDGAEVGVGEVGELLLRGPHVCNGYWNNPDATAAALDGDRWFHTGDLAKRDDEGFFTIAGRKKDMLISGGVNVYPAEIEAALLLHPAVADAAVVGVPHDVWGEAGIAFVVSRTSPAPSDGELTSFLEGRLARYKIPKAFVAVESLPRTAYGKVIKGELRDQYLTAHRRLR